MEELPIDVVSGQERKENAGWFRPGDQRINREGRPKGSKVVKDDSPAPDRAVRADRVMLLFVPSEDMTLCLSPRNAPRVTNLPTDAEIVSCRMDLARYGVVLTIRSSAFPRIAKGAAIPEFEPTYYGLRWRQKIPS